MISFILGYWLSVIVSRLSVVESWTVGTEIFIVELSSSVMQDVSITSKAAEMLNA